MSNTKPIILPIIICLCLYNIVSPFAGVYAQGSNKIKGTIRIPDSDNVQIIETIDGSTIMGRITVIEDDKIQFETDIGIIAVETFKIKEIKEVPISQFIGGSYWFPNPNDTRLLFAPTARCLKGGEGYFADYYLFFPMIAYGITDNITIAGGVSIFPWIGIENNLFYLMPKLGFAIGEKFNIAAGALLVKAPSFDDDSSPTVGICYGVATAGSANSNLTAGIGFGYVDWEFEDTPMLMLGGQHRVSRRLSLVTENWMSPGMDQPLVSLGLRFFGEKLSVDLGMVNTIGEDMIFPGIPYIDFVLKF
jgi:hypothetical protein